MKLPIPVATEEALYVDAEVDAPKASAIADTRRIIDQGNTYGSIARFVAGGIESLTAQDGTEVNDELKIQRLVKRMPYKTAEFLAIHVAVAVDDDDGFEGYYECPRCGHTVIREYRGEDEDNRDHISDLAVTYAQEEECIHSLNLERPVKIRDRKSGDVLEEIEAFTMEAPTIGTAEKSRNRYGAADAERQQYAMYIDSLKTVNGEEVSQKWRGEWGMFFFENMNARDRRRLFSEINKYGMEQAVPVTCPQCGKHWKARVNTANFFESALRSE